VEVGKRTWLGAEQETACWRLGGLQDGILCVPGGLHCCKSTQSVKKHCLGI
jgi:hypothetical protein